MSGEAIATNEHADEVRIGLTDGQCAVLRECGTVRKVINDAIEEYLQERNGNLLERYRQAAKTDQVTRRVRIPSRLPRPLTEENREWWETYASRNQVTRRVAAFLIGRSGSYVGFLAKAMGKRGWNLSIKEVRRFLREHPDWRTPAAPSIPQDREL